MREMWEVAFEEFYDPTDKSYSQESLFKAGWDAAWKRCKEAVSREIAAYLDKVIGDS